MLSACIKKYQKIAHITTMIDTSMNVVPKDVFGVMSVVNTPRKNNDPFGFRTLLMTPCKK